MSAESITAIECLVPAGEVPIVCEPRSVKIAPRTTYEAQFSLPYTVAAAFLDGRVGLGTFTSERLRDDGLLALVARVVHVARARPPATLEVLERAVLTLDGAPDVRKLAFLWRVY